MHCRVLPAPFSAIFPQPLASCRNIGFKFGFSFASASVRVQFPFLTWTCFRNIIDTGVFWQFHHRFHSRKKKCINLIWILSWFDCCCCFENDWLIQNKNKKYIFIFICLTLSIVLVKSRTGFWIVECKFSVISSQIWGRITTVSTGTQSLASWNWKGLRCQISLNWYWHIFPMIITVAMLCVELHRRSKMLPQNETLILVIYFRPFLICSRWWWWPSSAGEMIRLTQLNRMATINAWYWPYLWRIQVEIDTGNQLEFQPLLLGATVPRNCYKFSYPRPFSWFIRCRVLNWQRIFFFFLRKFDFQPNSWIHFEVWSQQCELPYNF